MPNGPFHREILICFSPLKPIFTLFDAKTILFVAVRRTTFLRETSWHAESKDPEGPEFIPDGARTRDREEEGAVLPLPSRIHA